ncbi:unannotated protein [freshwater metagenome]|uniref:Unannotated protein n=1 Tax=freshwater metagenome TaxID=449393 RepID=A0A6J6DL19_9ZZZZ
MFTKDGSKTSSEKSCTVSPAAASGRPGPTSVINASVTRMYPGEKISPASFIVITAAA